jgi:hypothetical protein
MEVHAAAAKVLVDDSVIAHTHIRKYLQSASINGHEINYGPRHTIPVGGQKGDGLSKVGHWKHRFSCTPLHALLTKWETKQQTGWSCVVSVQGQRIIGDWIEI